MNGQRATMTAGSRTHTLLTWEAVGNQPGSRETNANGASLTISR